MSIAGRHNKLTEYLQDGENRWHRMEDLLTADVFGAFRYLPPEVGVGAFLGRAVSCSGKSLATWMDERHLPLGELNRSDVLFWPEIAGKKPDVVVLLGNSETRAAVLVESKLHSPQHEIDGLSQLGFYSVAFARGGLCYEQEDVRLPPLRPVVYLTKHSVIPAGELERAELELSVALAESGSEEVEAAVFWLNWQAALELARKEWATRESHAPISPHWRVFEDLAKDLESRDISMPREHTSFPMPELAALVQHQPAAWMRLRFTGEDKRGARAFAPLPIIELPDVPAALSAWRIV